VFITVSDLDLRGELMIGLSDRVGDISPTWLSFEKMPEIDFKCSATKLSVKVEKLLRFIVNKVITKLLLHPNKLFI